jgi:predicted RNase H-like HicB family nuclease
MRTLRYTYWQDQEYFLGYLNDFPEYETQALSKEELVHNLKSLLDDIESGEIPFVRKVEDLVVA